MSLVLLRSEGGMLTLPDRQSLLVSREDGGNLVVNPPRSVWERSELTAEELTRFAFLVSAAGRAMIDTLPQLADGCINYWEAGNWALNDAASPPGRKAARRHRQMHLHLLGRSPTSTNPAWRWGESPIFPAFAERHSWASRFERLTAAECRQIVDRAETLLRTTYGLDPGKMVTSSPCDSCGYPTPMAIRETTHRCVECGRRSGFSRPSASSGRP
jgi:diadenosine tetraphosphate (Ap4A) HIT family hydrolase